MQHKVRRSKLEGCLFAGVHCLAVRCVLAVYFQWDLVQDNVLFIQVSHVTSGIHEVVIGISVCVSGKSLSGEASPTDGKSTLASHASQCHHYLC